jgi:type III pantothenate kinase
MNLIIDIGNTSTKLALYENNRKLSVARVNNLTGEELERILTGYRIEKAIVSSVQSMPPFLTEMVSSNVRFFHLLSFRSKLPFRIEYDTPETLGPDRIAGVAGAYGHFPDSELLVIDAGTAITYDYLSGGTYSGGNISPGLNIRLKALNAYTGRLPLVLIDEDFTDPGRNTRDAILAGVIRGVLYEINEYIRTFEKKSSDIKIILTGGDSEFLKSKIMQGSTHMPDVVIDGLNYILEYNAL